MFTYKKSKGEDVSFLLDRVNELNSEKNSIISKFNTIGVKATSALQSQALLTLKKEYCDKERCAECKIGIDIVKL